jgi:hypothetical protein
MWRFATPILRERTTGHAKISWSKVTVCGRSWWQDAWLLLHHVVGRRCIGRLHSDTPLYKTVHDCEDYPLQHRNGSSATECRNISINLCVSMRIILSCSVYSLIVYISCIMQYFNNTVSWLFVSKKKRKSVPESRETQFRVFVWV